MKKVLLALLSFAICAMAGDVSGKWNGTFTPDNGDEGHPALIILTQDGNKLSGSGGPDESKQFPFKDGKIDGNHLTFEVTADEGTFAFDLTLMGDQITGTLKFKNENETRTAKVSLKRQGA